MAAAEAAAAKLEEQQAHKAELEAQLAVLVEKRQATEADYVKGIRAKWGAGAAGEISESGWARPVAGYISSGYGYRYHPIYGDWRMHNGTDIAGMGCGAPIYAAHGRAPSPTPARTGRSATTSRSTHDDGSSTGYGHIMSGGIGVRIGQDGRPGSEHRASRLDRRLDRMPPSLHRARRRQPHRSGALHAQLGGSPLASGSTTISWTIGQA